MKKKNPLLSPKKAMTSIKVKSQFSPKKAKSLRSLLTLAYQAMTRKKKLISAPKKATTLTKEKFPFFLMNKKSHKGSLIPMSRLMMRKKSLLTLMMLMMVNQRNQK